LSTLVLITCGDVFISCQRGVSLGLGKIIDAPSDYHHLCGSLDGLSLIRI